MALTIVMNKKTFRIACIRKGVSGPQVARAVGVAVSTLWSWANNYWSPSPNHRRGLAEFLAIPESELFMIEPKKNNAEARDPGASKDKLLEEEAQS